MAQLIITASIAIVPPVNATPKVRQSIEALRREIAPGLQQVLNRAVGRIRQSGPRQTGRMASRARVRRLRPQLPGGVSAELRLPLFYSSFTNETNPSRGWFDQLEKDVERALVVLGNGYVSRLAEIYVDQLFGRLVRVAARSRGTVRVRRTPGDFTSAGASGLLRV